MPRPPKAVTIENFSLLHSQLVRLLSDKIKAATALNGPPELAIPAFDAVGDSPALLDEWVNRWLTPSARKRMWASQRQKLYKEKRKVRVIMVSDEAYTALSNVARRQKMTLSGTILFLTAVLRKD